MKVKEKKSPEEKKSSPFARVGDLREMQIAANKFHQAEKVKPFTYLYTRKTRNIATRIPCNPSYTQKQNALRTRP